MMEMRDRLRHENEADVARTREAMCAQELEVARLKVQAEEHAHVRHQQAKQLERSKRKQSAR